MSFHFILFDLDGTISDPIEGIWRSLNFSLGNFGYPQFEKSDIPQFIGPPLDEAFAQIAGTSDPDHIKQLVSKYRERFSEIGYQENELYPGIEEVLKTLKAHNIQLGVCTSKREDFAIKILEMFGLYGYFLFVSGGDIGIKKSQQIQQLLSSNLISRNAVMVGDRAVDIIAAHQNQIYSAGVLWGYGSTEELQEQSPDYLLKKPEDLLMLIG
jgi:phosphoglycolate phosphatase